MTREKLVEGLKKELEETQKDIECIKGSRKHYYLGDALKEKTKCLEILIAFYETRITI